MICITAGSATAAVAGCLDSGGSDSDDDTGSESDNETGAGEELDENETETDGATDSSGNVVAVGPEDGPTRFEPEMLELEPGQRVTFEWRSDNHNIVVEEKPAESDWSGQEEVENTGYTHEHRFDVEGEYRYICEPHAPEMRGVIVVGDVDSTTDGSDGTQNSTADSTGTPENRTAGSHNSTGSGNSTETTSGPQENGTSSPDTGSDADDT